MRVRSILEAKGSDVVTISPDAKALDAVMLMRRADIGALVVVDDRGHLVGMLSEREIARTLATATYRVVDMRVAQLMCRDLVHCEIDDDVHTVMALMTHARARHVPVFDGGRLAGIVSLGDVVKARLEEIEMEVRVLRDLQIARVSGSR
jgi:CBS domain-containing protein